LMAFVLMLSMISLVRADDTTYSETITSTQTITTTVYTCTVFEVSPCDYSMLITVVIIIMIVACAFMLLLRRD